MDKDLEKTIEFTMEKMMEDEKKLMFQVKDMMDRVGRERSRADMLKKKVQLHDLLRTQDQDIMLAALGKKVTKVHASCTDSRFTHLNTLEQLCSIEYRISLLVQQIEAIPEEIFKELWQIKDAERKSRLREEKLRLEREKQMERTKKCIERSLGEGKKKKTGRKPMPRCMPVKQKIKVIDEPSGPAEDELHADLFSEGFD
ncbi:cilia- and flagella-associated protein 100-like [Menidia menidia]